MSLDFPALWNEATPWTEFLTDSMDQAALWRGVSDHVVIPGWALEGFMRSPVRKLLVLAADWCGDAANTVPILARLAELIPGMSLRILERHRFPHVMERYLTNGSRSIPIAIALSDGLDELGHWGPRPSALQEWTLENRTRMPSQQRYAYARRWYAKDRGESTLRELLAAVQR